MAKMQQKILLMLMAVSRALHYAFPLKKKINIFEIFFNLSYKNGLFPAFYLIVAKIQNFFKNYIIISVTLMM